uniref:Steroid nuclear receptor ligand-binding n=1 Tax=Aegilops tauschii TaxID=37682 RepID=M8BMT2_AEGTA
MEPPSSSRLWASLWTFIKFLPYFCGLFILGLIKGDILISLLCCFFWYSAMPLGMPYYGNRNICTNSWVMAYASDLDILLHHQDGTWSTITGSCTVVRDLKDMLFHSYFSIMDDLRLQTPCGKPYEIRLLDIPGALLSAACGLILDVIMFTLIAIYKCPVMLFKGWKRLIQDLIGREGPFLETACVPFAGLAILLWPFAVLGAVLASILSSIPLGLFGAVVAYQESSVVMGLSYAVSSVSIFDEYTNDVLDMAPGSCFPRLKYRKQKNEDSSHGGQLSKPGSFDKENQEGKKPLNRVTSFKNSMDEFNPFKMLDHLFAECKRQGEVLVNEGVITMKDIQETKSGKVGSGVLNVGLPAYVILNALLRSAKSNSNGLILSDGTEITSDNRPKSTLFDWFFDPLMIIKEQIKAENFTEEEEECLKMRVLMVGEPSNLKVTLPHVPSLNERKKAEIDAFARSSRGRWVAARLLMIIKEQIKAENFTEEEEECLKMRVLMVGEPSNLKVTLPHVPSLNERKKAEIDAFARRLQGITKSISRYPTSKRRFDVLVKSLLSELERTMGGSAPANGSQALRLRGGIARMLSQKSVGKTANIMDEDPEAQVARKALTP